MRIFCLFPEGRDLKRAMVSHWEGERADTLGCCRGWLHRHSGYRSWKPGWGKRQRIQPIWLIALPGNMERPVRVPPFISAQDTHQDRLRRAHMPCGYSRLTSQGIHSQQAQDPAGSWHNLGKPDYPRHDEPVDPGTDELANHKDIFFIIPGRNMTTLFINSPDIT